MNELLTALPSAWIDRLFDRFAVLYGKHWFDLWVDVPMADVKDGWSDGLRGISGQQIIAGLEKVGKFPPTLPEFVALCKPPAVAAAHRPFLPAPKPARGAIDARVRSEVDRYLKNAHKPDPKDWARKILVEAGRGDYRILIGIEFAKEALGLEVAS